MIDAILLKDLKKIFENNTVEEIERGLKLIQGVEKNRTDEMRIRTLLKNMGMPVNLSGYRYMVTLISEYLKKEDIYRERFTEAYYMLADKYNKRWGSIERGLRYAMEQTFLNQNVELIERIFGYSISKNTGLPKLSQFVYTIVEYLKFQQDFD